MGSSSDEPVVKETLEVLEQMQVDYEVRVMSAHRTPERGAGICHHGPGPGH